MSNPHLSPVEYPAAPMMSEEVEAFFDDASWVSIEPHPSNDVVPDERPLSELSEEELLRAVHLIVVDSRKLLARLIVHLAEVERRRLWDKLGCTSLNDYCKRRLRMSHDAAYRRANAARLALRWPFILEKLEAGEIHMTALFRLQPYLNDENCRELVELATDRTKEQIDELLAERFPQPDAPSNIRPAPLLPGERLPPEGLHSPAFPGGQAAPAHYNRTILEPTSPGKHRVEFTASDELRKKLEHARSLMRHANPKGDLGLIVERALDLLIPRLERERFGKTIRPRKPGAPLPTLESDHIPAAIRHAVAERDNYECTYCDAEGNRCRSRDFIEYDHIIPRARGGQHTVENLRIRCHVHNQLAAAEIFGREHIENRTKERREKSARELRAVDEPAATRVVPEMQESKPIDEAPATVAGSSDVQRASTSSDGSPRPDPLAVRHTFKQVEGALMNLGFKKKEALEAVATVGPAMEPSQQVVLLAVLREAIELLTPRPARTKANRHEPRTKSTSPE